MGHSRDKSLKEIWRWDGQNWQSRLQIVRSYSKYLRGELGLEIQTFELKKYCRKVFCNVGGPTLDVQIVCGLLLRILENVDDASDIRPVFHKESLAAWNIGIGNSAV